MKTVSASQTAPPEPVRAAATPVEAERGALPVIPTQRARAAGGAHDEPLAAFLRSFVYAGSGLWHTIRTQRNMRVHAALAVAAIALGITLRLSPVEFAIIFIVITGVVVTEMFNTVAEAVVDLATNEYHPLARVAKDVAAGAVLLNSILAVVVALFIYVPHLWPLLLHLLKR